MYRKVRPSLNNSKRLIFLLQRYTIIDNHFVLVSFIDSSDASNNAQLAKSFGSIALPNGVVAIYFSANSLSSNMDLTIGVLIVPGISVFTWILSIAKMLENVLLNLRIVPFEFAYQG